MGQIVFNEAQIRSITHGTTQIKEVWVGNVKIWPTSSTTGVPVDGQSGFIFDVSPVVVSRVSTSGTTNTTVVKFNADGTMGFEPDTATAVTTIKNSNGVDITWARWNTNVSALVNPRVDFNLIDQDPGFNDIQVSTDLGSTWTTILETGSDGAGPLEGYPLTNGVWLRLPISTVSSSVGKTVPNIQISFWNNGAEVQGVAGVNNGVIEFTMVSGIVLASNPFVSNFGSLLSKVTQPAGTQATAYCTIFGPTHPYFPGKIEVQQRPVLGDPEESAYYNWIVPGQTAPADGYDVLLTNWEFLEPLPPTNVNGGYNLANNGEFRFELTAVETSTTYKTGIGDVAIRRNNVAVSSGGVTLSARSIGVL